MSVINIVPYMTVVYCRNLSLFTMNQSHFINTSPNTETIQNVSVTVKQWGVKHAYFQLYKHMHCLLGDGLNTACDSTIDRLPKSPNAFKYRNWHRCETNKLLSFIKIYIYQKKLLTYMLSLHVTMFEIICFYVFPLSY